ncbi:hypothetical protein CRUP_037373 [Coryphaenoides rupestris]|nr:hypothetical protein CRUP_037373 [Coryphaenoides rupestris]
MHLKASAVFLKVQTLQSQEPSSAAAEGLVWRFGLHGKNKHTDDDDDAVYDENSSYVPNFANVTFQRVVNIVERRSAASRPELEHDQVYFAPEWYDNRFSIEDNEFYNFQRNSTPPQEPALGQEEGAGEVRRSREAQPGRRFSETDAASDNRGPRSNHDYRRWDPQHPMRDRSPLRRDAHGAAPGPHPAAGFRGRGRSFSPPDREKVQNVFEPDFQRPGRADITQLGGDSGEPPCFCRGVCGGCQLGAEPRTRRGLKSAAESRPASVTESAAAASSEPSLAPDEDLRARRSQAIASKALEIEEDCQTFGTVVQLLVEKEPSLDGLLLAPLRDNLLELKQRCLDDLRHFIKELDQSAGGGSTTTTTTTTTTSTSTTTTTTTTEDSAAESSVAATEASTTT